MREDICQRRRGDDFQEGKESTVCVKEGRLLCFAPKEKEEVPIDLRKKLQQGGGLSMVGERFEDCIFILFMLFFIFLYDLECILHV